jgi:hypothetical protein
VPCDPGAIKVAAVIVEPAKSTVLEKLGEGTQALGIATGWLRPRLAPVSASAGLAE